jgi:diphosphomevalonate decarboxylase
MSRRVTIEAPANIAFIKYWGARDLERAVPVNPSISMTLTRCVSTTTVEPLGDGEDDEVLLAGNDGLDLATGSFRRRIVEHLGRLRDWDGTRAGFRIATRNSFPSSAGMASSASGFAALTTAVVAALGRSVDEATLSELARLSGSGSASRSVIGGYVEWPAEGSGDRCYAEQLAPPEHWALCDVVALVQEGPKKVSSLDGHVRAVTSPHFERRLALIDDRLAEVRAAIADRDIERLGPVLEEDAVELHLIAMSSRPPIFYWTPPTLAVMAAMRRLRDRGVSAWVTMDAGANVHVMCEPESEQEVVAALLDVEGVVDVLRDRVGPGPRRLDEDLLVGYAS